MRRNDIFGLKWSDVDVGSRIGGPCQLSESDEMRKRVVLFTGAVAGAVLAGFVLGGWSARVIEKVSQFSHVPRKSILAVVPSGELVLWGTGPEKGEKTVIPNAVLRADVPDEILEIIRQDSGYPIQTTTLSLSGFRATKPPTPLLEGVKGFTDQDKLFGIKLEDRRWEYKVVEATRTSQSVSSLNACTIRARLPNASYDILAVWDVVKCGESDGRERIEGSIQWLGPFKVPAR